jgi:hypothetical protein
VAECKRITGLAKLFLNLIEIQDMCAGIDPKTQQALSDRVAECAAIHEELMWHMEHAKAPYLHPQTLRDLSFMKRFIEELSERIQKGTEIKDLFLNTEPLQL